MLFNSLGFLFLFLPIVLFGFFLLRRGHVLFLTIASLVFYACWHTPDILLLTVSIVINYLFGTALQRKPNKTTLWAGLIFNLAVIAWFKYTNFLISIYNHLGDGHFAALNIVLPLGVSFFTLHQITWLVDSYHGKIKRTPFQNYALYIAFFPQLIAGPIVRYTEVMQQYTQKTFGKFSLDLFVQGAFLFCIGLCKKVLLADMFALYASPVFDHAQLGVPLNSVEAYIGVFSYGLQIYFDFSAYSDMALGLGLIFGIHLPLNFNSPYKATSIIDFWHRWHMTLSRFLRDYLYIPLGGNRKGPLMRSVNLMIVMLIGGLWHGANWTFVVWGGLHGVYLLINHAWRQFCPQAKQTPILSGALTFIAVMIAWVFFRADSIPSALTILDALTLHNPGPTIAVSNTDIALLLFGAILIWFAPNSQEWIEGFKRQKAITRTQWQSLSLALGAFTGLAIFLTFTGIKSEFIYFQF